jgi:hypothetical protein
MNRYAYILENGIYCKISFDTTIIYDYIDVLFAVKGKKMDVKWNRHGSIPVECFPSEYLRKYLEHFEEASLDWSGDQECIAISLI